MIVSVPILSMLASTCACTFITVAILYAGIARAQWERVGSEAFTDILIWNSDLVLLNPTGQVLRSTDSGRTWTCMVNSGSKLARFDSASDSVLSIWRKDNQILLTTDWGRTWRTKAPTVEALREAARNVRSDHFIDSLMKWKTRRLACIDEDGEEAWSSISHDTKLKIHAVTPFGERLVAVGEPGVVLVIDSNNNGRLIHSSEFQSDKQSGAAIKVAFADRKVGLVAYQHLIQFTLDSGRSWSKLLMPEADTLYEIHLLSNSRVLVRFSNNILRAFDLERGKEWFVDTLSNDNWELIVFGDQLIKYNDKHIFSIGIGESYAWDRRYSARPTESIIDVALLSNKIILIASRYSDFVGDAPLTHLTISTDAGDSWKAFGSINGRLIGMKFRTSKFGIAQLAEGYMIATVDSGRSWFTTFGTELKLSTNAFMEHDSVCVGLSEDGVLLNSPDVGFTWHRVLLDIAVLPGNSRFSNFCVVGNLVYVVNDHGLYRYRVITPKRYSYVPSQEIPNRSLECRVYPNPATTVIKLFIARTQLSDLTQLGIRDEHTVEVQCPIVATNTLEDDLEITLDISHLEVGNYYIFVGSEASSKLLRFTKR